MPQFTCLAFDNFCEHAIRLVCQSLSISIWKQARSIAEPLLFPRSEGQHAKIFARRFVARQEELALGYLRVSLSMLE